MRVKIAVIISLVLCMASCGRMYEYKDLDGMWQMRSMEKDGVKEQVVDIYYSFQKHTINLRQVNSYSYFGGYVYVGDSILVKMPADTPKEGLNVLGVDTNEPHFCVEKVTSNTLILKTDYARLEFRKY